MDKKFQVLFGLVITFVASVCWKNDFIRFLFGFEILVVLLCLLELWLLRNKVSLTLILPERVVYRKERFPVHVQAVSRFPLPIPKLNVQVAIVDRFTNKELLASGTFMMDRKETGQLQLLFDAGYCGVFDVRMVKLRMWDHLGLFCRQYRLKEHAWTIYVLPAEASADYMDVSVGRSEMEGEEIQFRAGQAAVDSADIREYRMGDNVKHIHWKISAKLDDLMVRIMGQPVEKMNQVYLNLQYEDKKLSRDTWEKFLAVVARVSKSMVNAEHGHKVCWIDVEAETQIEFQVTDAATMQDMLCGLLHARPWRHGEATAVLEEIRWDEDAEEIIEINLQGEIISSGKAG